MLLDTDTFTIINMVLSFGAPMALAVQQLYAVRRSRRGGNDGGSALPKPVPTPLPGDDGLPPLPKELVDLVVDARAPQSAPRELERV